MAAQRVKRVLGSDFLGRVSRLLREPAAAETSAGTWQQPVVQAAHQADERSAAFVFLGPPGVGKGTYSTRVAEHFGLPHISAGDLARTEMRADSARGRQMEHMVNAGELLPDSLILAVLNDRLASGRAAGEAGVLLDGFPRTRPQAEALTRTADVKLAINLHVREEILIAKCLGRRICGHCGKNYNIADIYIPSNGDAPAVTMPPLRPPPECEAHMERRSDDTLEVIKKRLEVYNAAAAPVEEFFREQGTLLDFDIYGSIPETLPRLLAAIGSHTVPAAARKQRAAVV